MVIDSNFESKELILQNPAKPCIDDILNSLGVMKAEYCGFDGKPHSGQIVIATEVMPEVESFFDMALDIEFQIERLIPVSAPPYRWDSEKVLRDNLSSGFDYRTIADTDKVSQHGLGLAFDINPRQNPYIVYTGSDVEIVPVDGSWSPARPGTLHAAHPLVKLMEGFGWEWGGNWLPSGGRTDFMHFQKQVM